MKYPLLIISCLSLLACAEQPIKPIPDMTSQVPVFKNVYYDGVNDDLLTAGLGLQGLRGAAPELAENPSAAALRQASYYHQFRALNDVSAAGGFGSLYGFSATQKPITGHEYWSQRAVAPLAFHTVVLQIPDNFMPNKACLVVAPSSGSRNVLGAVSTSGAWALLRGCAVVYTDKGTGTQIALDAQQSYQIDGTMVASTKLSEGGLERTKLNSPSNLHVVQKHAYSQANPEQYWGDFVLDAAVYGLSLLQQEHGLNRAQTKVIAASISNGGGAVLRATEIDAEGLIDAVVAGEPQVNLRHQYDLLKAGKQKSISTKPLLELAMHLSLFEPCAALHDSLNDSPFKMNTVLLQPAMQARCQALQEQQLLAGDKTTEQSQNALALITGIHITNEALQLAQLNTLANLWGSINHTYSNSYLRKSAADNLCQSAMSAFSSNGQPRTLSAKEVSGMFALSSGIAPSNGIELAYTNAENTVQSRMPAAPGFGFESQLCFYQLLNSPALNAAFAKIESQPEKNTVPTLILHGQADGTVAINHASRAYYHKNQSSEAANAQLRYYELEHVQHFDAFLAYPGFNQQFVPMHPYFEQALDLIYAHLFAEQSLPPSQLIKTKPRGLLKGQVPALSATHIPAIQNSPQTLIKIKQQQLEIE